MVCSHNFTLYNIIKYKDNVFLSIITKQINFMSKIYLKLIESSQGKNEALIFINGYRMKYKNKSKVHFF